MNVVLRSRAPEKAGCKKIFREKVSGNNRERPQFQRMLELLNGDRQTDHNRIREAGDAHARSSPSLYAICARYISNVESK